MSVHDMYTEIMYTYTAEFLVPFSSSMPLDAIRELGQKQQSNAQSLGSVWQQHQSDIERYARNMGQITNRIQA